MIIFYSTRYSLRIPIRNVPREYLISQNFSGEKVKNTEVSLLIFFCCQEKNRYFSFIFSTSEQIENQNIVSCSTRRGLPTTL